MDITHLANTIYQQNRYVSLFCTVLFVLHPLHCPLPTLRRPRLVAFRLAALFAFLFLRVVTTLLRRLPPLRRTFLITTSCLLCSVLLDSLLHSLPLHCSVSSFSTSTSPSVSSSSACCSSSSRKQPTSNTISPRSTPLRLLLVHPPSHPLSHITTHPDTHLTLLLTALHTAVPAVHSSGPSALWPSTAPSRAATRTSATRPFASMRLTSSHQ